MKQLQRVASNISTVIHNRERQPSWGAHVHKRRGRTHSATRRAPRIDKTTDLTLLKENASAKDTLSEDIDPLVAAGGVNVAQNTRATGKSACGFDTRRTQGTSRFMLWRTEGVCWPRPFEGSVSVGMIGVAYEFAVASGFPGTETGQNVGFLLHSECGRRPRNALSLSNLHNAEGAKLEFLHAAVSVPIT